jgi:hypothetical protein
MARTWTSSERQGPGRRYWFATNELALAFLEERKRAGFRGDVSYIDPTYPDQEPSVWLTKSRGSQARDVLEGGIDTLAVEGYR